MGYVMTISNEKGRDIVKIFSTGQNKKPEKRSVKNVKK